MTKLKNKEIPPNILEVAYKNSEKVDQYGKDINIFFESVKGKMGKINLQKLEALRRKYYKKRLLFVNFCIKYRFPYEKIGELLGVTKQRVYQIQRYGFSGKVTRSEKIKVIERDRSQCIICFKKHTKKKPLHIHHILNPKNKNLSNLVSLCAVCHLTLGNLNRQDREFKQFYEKKLSTQASLQK